MNILTINKDWRGITCFSITKENIFKEDNIIVNNLYQISVGDWGNRKEVLIFEYEEQLHFLYIKDTILSRKKEFIHNSSEYSILVENKDIKGTEEVKVSEITKIENIISIPLSEVFKVNTTNVINRFSKLENDNLKNVIINTCNREIDKLTNIDTKHQHPSILTFSNNCLWLKEGIFDIAEGVKLPNILFMFNDVKYSKNTIISKNGEVINITPELFFFDKDEEDNDVALSNIELNSLPYLDILFRKIDEEHYLGYKFNQDNIISLFSKTSSGGFETSYKKLTIKEDEEEIVILEDTYDDEKEVIYKRKFNFSGDILTIKDKTFEYDTKIKTKIIDQWNSILWDFVLLENGQLWGYTKNWNSIVDEVLLEENCTKLDFIIGWNSSTTIIKTNNCIHYFPRNDYYGDEKNITKLHYIEELDEYTKDNSIVKIPFISKYSKTNKIYTLQLLQPFNVLLNSDNSTTLENTSEENFLYDYKKGVVTLELEDKIYTFVLEQKNINEKYYSGTDIFNTEKNKRWPGMDKFIIKENTNYVLIKSKNKKRVFVYLEEKDENNTFSSNDTYFKEANNYHIDNDSFGNLGTKFFNDKELPNLIEKADYKEIISLIYPKGEIELKKGSKYQRITTPSYRGSQKIENLIK